jgi:hypothetical protein
MKYFLLVLPIFISMQVSGQLFQKNKTETTKEFIDRVKPNDSATITGDIIETTLWEKNKKIIFTFYQQNIKYNDSITEPSVTGIVYVPTIGNSYQSIIIDDYLQEGANAQITSVFFANIDKDAKKELVIICNWPQQHHDVSGNLYQTFFYDNIGSNTALQKKLTPITKFDKYFKIEFDGYTEGKTVKAKYTTATQVRKKLKKLGY